MNFPLPSLRPQGIVVPKGVSPLKIPTQCGGDFRVNAQEIVPTFIKFNEYAVAVVQRVRKIVKI